MASILDILGGVAKGASAAQDASISRKDRERKQTALDQEERDRLARKKAFAQYLDGMNPQGVGEVDDLSEADSDSQDQGYGVAPDAPRSLRVETPSSSKARAKSEEPQSRRSLNDQFQGFDPNRDYETEAALADRTRSTERQARIDQEAVDNTKATRAETQRKTAESESEKADKKRRDEASNKTAYEAAKRLKAPEAQAPYNADVDYGDIYTRYNQERTATRGDDANDRGSEAASRAADASDRASRNEASRLAAESRRDTQADAALEARGALTLKQLPRMPPADQAGMRAAHDEVAKAHPDLSPNKVWGIVAEQYEKNLLPGQKPRVTTGAQGTAPTGMVRVEDPEVRAAIEEARKASRGGGE